MIVDSMTYVGYFAKIAREDAYRRILCLFLSFFVGSDFFDKYY